MKPIHLVVLTAAVAGSAWLGSSLYAATASSHPAPAMQTTATPVSTNSAVSQPTLPQHSAGQPHTPALATAAAEQSLADLVWEQARQGKVINASLVARSSLYDTLQKEWGEPTATFSTNGLQYAVYPNRQLTVGYNKGMQIVDIRSTDPRLRELKLADMQKSWGPPTRTTLFSNQLIYTYQPTSQFLLRVIFPVPTASMPNPGALSTEVVAPAGLRNLMLYGAAQDLLRGVLDLAKEGKVLNAPYSVKQTVFDTVEKEWGAPATRDAVNGISYAAYPERGVIFGFNKGMQLVDIRSYDLRLQELTQSQVEKALGKPQSITKQGTQQIAVYQVTPDYQLKVVYLPPTAANKDPRVDHMNIVYPQGLINQMAQ